MTDLTFAIEAARRGCEYVSLVNGHVIALGKHSDLWNRHDRFVFGATLAMWAEMQLLEKLEYADLVALEGIRQQARAFAKGE